MPDNFFCVRIREDFNPETMANNPRHEEEGLIDLRGTDEPEFRINRVPEDRESGQRLAHSGLNNSQVSGTPVSDGELAALKPDDKVKIKFDKFVNLIATHAYQEIFDKHLGEDVIISTDLLADLANAHEEKEDGKKGPIFLFAGILIGVLVTWMLLKSGGV